MKKLMISVLFSIMLLVLAACGGNEADSASNNEDASENTVNLVASNYEFGQENYTAEAGEVTVNLKNEDGYHGISIEGTDLKIDGEGSATANLVPGEYSIICSVPCGEGHAEMGTKLVVQ